MKEYFHRIKSNPSYTRLFYWGKLITVTGTAQIIVQGIGLLCGILVIRFLSPNEYALYTLANTMLGTMVILADGGISMGAMSQAGKVWQDKRKLGLVLSTGLDLRKKFAAGSLLISLPILFYLLTHHGSDWKLSIVIILSIVPAFYASLSGSLLEIVPKIMQDITKLQKVQVITNIARLCILFAVLLLFPFAFVAILAAGVPQLWQNKRLHKISGEHASTVEKPDPLIRKEMLYIVKRNLPGAIYYCVAGQLTIWLISIFGATTSVAKVGALGRIAMLLTLFGILFNTLFLPRFARLPHQKKLLLNRFVQIQAGLVVLGLLIVLTVYLFSSQILWILGPNYSNLKTEFLLNITASYIGLMGGFVYVLNSSRGWIINPFVALPFNLAIIATGIFLIDISTIKGIFIFNIYVCSAELLLLLIYSMLKISRLKNKDIDLQPAINISASSANRFK